MTAVISIGVWRGVSLEVASWDGACAAVDLSAACLLEREPAGVALAGGARHLDQTLGGAMLTLRAARTFRGSPGETMLFDCPPEGLAARAVLVIGLGDPGAWAPDRSAEAAAVAARIGLARRDASVAFAPSLLDAGVRADGAGGKMLAAVAAVIETAAASAAAGLASPPSLRRFVFDAGKKHIDAAAQVFRKAFAALPSND